MHRRTVLAASIAGLGFAGQARAQTRATIRLAHEAPPTHAKGLWAQWFKEAAETAGEIAVHLFPQGQLYKSEQAALEATVSGVIQMAIPSTGYLSSVAPWFEVFDLPMLFADEAALHRFQDSEAGGALLARLQERGLVGLGYASNVALDLFSRVPIRELGDFAGRKIRVHTAALERTVRALGGNPVTIPAAELFVALQQGVVDGALTTVAFAAPNRYHEVTKYLTRCSLSAVAYVAVMNAGFHASLTETARLAVARAAAAAMQRNRASLADQTAQHVEMLRRGGVTVIDLAPSERALWQQRLAPLYDDAARRIDPRLIEQARRIS
jgi:C4-dicarboxylate-binding protein DctP